MARSVDLARNYSGFLAANPLDGRLTPVWRAAKHPGAALRQLAASGQAAPPGGNFDRFDLADQAIPAPSNHHGAVAFFASLPRAKAEEGLFITSANGVASWPQPMSSARSTSPTSPIGVLSHLMEPARLPSRSSWRPMMPDDRL